MTIKNKTFNGKYQRLLFLYFGIIGFFAEIRFENVVFENFNLNYKHSEWRPSSPLVNYLLREVKMSTQKYG